MILSGIFRAVRREGGRGGREGEEGEGRKGERNGGWEGGKRD